MSDFNAPVDQLEWISFSLGWCRSKFWKFSLCNGNIINFYNSLAGESKLDTSQWKEKLVQNCPQLDVVIHHHQSWHQWNKELAKWLVVCPIKVRFGDFSKKWEFWTWNNFFEGQSFLQQTNRQNDELRNQLPQEAFPQSFDQKQPQNEKSQGFGSSGGGFGISLKSGQL